MPKEVENLFSVEDYTELGYRHIARLRQNAVNTPEDIETLAEHDRIEKDVAESPQELLREAHKAIDHGTSLLMKLIRVKKLRQTIMPTEKGIAAGVKPHSWDKAFECLVSRIDYSNRQLVRLAEIDIPKARQSLFYQAKILTEAFMRLAQAFPEDFRDAAESSLTMPSLRARTAAFSADAVAIAKKIHLAEKHPASDISDNRERLGALCHVLVAEFVQAVEWERRSYRHDVETFKMLKAFHETAAKYKNVAFGDYLKSLYYPIKLEGMLVSAELPTLKIGPEVWWRRRILPMVKKEFEIISNHPTRNAALRDELKAKTRKFTPAAMRRLMEKNCRNKLFRISQACP
jgi:hypothetical protein